MEEQRQTVRLNVNAIVHFRIDGQETAQTALASRALSVEGIQLFIPGRIGRKQRVELEIYPPNHESTLELSGEVVWVESVGDVYEGYYVVGVRFLELAEPTRQAIEALIQEELSRLKPIALGGS